MSLRLVARGGSNGSRLQLEVGRPAACGSKVSQEAMRVAERQENRQTEGAEEKDEIASLVDVRRDTEFYLELFARSAI